MLKKIILLSSIVLGGGIAMAANLTIVQVNCVDKSSRWVAELSTKEKIADGDSVQAVCSQASKMQYSNFPCLVENGTGKLPPTLPANYAPWDGHAVFRGFFSRANALCQQAVLLHERKAQPIQYTLKVKCTQDGLDPQLSWPITPELPNPHALVKNHDLRIPDGIQQVGKQLCQRYFDDVLSENLDYLKDVSHKD